jgi:hypothetical protein
LVFLKVPNLRDEIKKLGMGRKFRGWNYFFGLFKKFLDLMPIMPLSPYFTETD